MNAFKYTLKTSLERYPFILLIWFSGHLFHMLFWPTLSSIWFIVFDAILYLGFGAIIATHISLKGFAREEIRGAGAIAVFVAGLVHMFITLILAGFGVYILGPGWMFWKTFVITLVELFGGILLGLLISHIIDSVTNSSSSWR